MVGQRRDVQVDALASIGFALTVERLVLAELGIEDHRQQARPDMTTRNDVERGRRLGDLLARSAGELLTNGLDHLPLTRHDLPGLGDGLAELGELAAATRAGGRAGDHDALARQMPRKGQPHRLSAGEGVHRSGFRFSRPGSDAVFRGTRFQLFELQFQLVEQLATALGGLAVLFTPQLDDL
jgi:hypothetical protein